MNLLKLDSKLGIIIILLFISFDLLAVAFRGRIYSRVKGKGEGGVTVFIFETKQAYRTDENGYFDAEVPELGQYTFRILRVTGMQELKKSVTADGQVVTIYTDKKKKPKGAIVVEGKKKKTILSRHKLRYEEIKRMPGTLGEALSSLQTLPGVFAPPFGFGQLVIRGADPDTNLYLYDDLPIAYAYHFDSINSVIHNDLIKSIDLYTGPYPARFYNALGGIIEIESTDTVTKPTGQFSTSILMSQGMYQTPILDGKGYIAAGGKVGYLDKTIGQTSFIPDGIRLPQYHSTNLKFVYKFNEEHQVSFTSLTASDNFVLNAPSTSSNDPTEDPFANFAGASVSAGQGFETYGLRHIWTPGDNFSNRLTLIRYNPHIKTNISVGAIEAKIIAKAPYNGLRQDAEWKAGKMFKVDFGTEIRSMSYIVNGFGVVQKDPTNPSPNPYDTIDPDYERRDAFQKTKFLYQSAYATLHFQYGNFALEPGARYYYLANNKQSALSPNVVGSYKFEGIGKGTTVFGGVGKYHHYPFFSQIPSEEAGNPDVKFQKILKYSGGVEQMVTDDWQVKIEGFKQEFSDLIERDPYVSEFIGLNPDKSQWLTNPLVLNRPLNYSNSGDGWSHGVELMIRKTSKPGKRDWFGWISYTWSQTFRNRNQFNSDYLAFGDRDLILSGDEQRFRALFPNTQELIYEYDITHIVNVVYGWRLSKEWQIGGRWFYRTAYPYTPVIGDDGGQFKNPVNNQTYWAAKYSDNPYSADYVNSRRQKPYHRLDIRIDKFLNYEWGYMNVYLEIINVYVRRNANEESFSSAAPFSNTNPSKQYDFFTLQSGGYLLPFYNMGLELRF